MSRRIGLVAAILLSGIANANNPFPAVDLPSVVPESVRDRVARELASTRDTLGWTIHPFRGEFHGLGNPVGGASQAHDLSANGRVVVGTDVDDLSGSRAFVWSPWTGRAQYDMGPGNTVATAISADGVYVAGNAGDNAFRWSLAGGDPLPPVTGQRDAAAISGNGSIVVGSITPSVPVYFPWIDIPIAIEAEDSAAISRSVVISSKPTSAYSWSRPDGSQPLPSSPEYYHQSAVDVSFDGETVLGNSERQVYFISPGSTVQNAEPALWRNGSLQLLGGLPRFFDDLSNIHLSAWSSTIGTAISADGKAVVGLDTQTIHPSVITHVWPPAQVHPDRRAVLWREETGWIDLGDAEIDPNWVHRGDAATDVSADGSVVVGQTSFQRRPLVEIFGSGSSLGYEYAPIEQTPFLWDESRGMRDLADVLQYDYGLDLGDWDLREATAISDDGTTVIGNGVNPDGDSEAWRAVLRRETPDGDLDFDGDVDHLDYATLMGNLGLDSDESAVFYADGDLNADGRVDAADSMALLGLYDYRSIGDYNADGVVDLGDYTVWRDHLGELARGVADGNGDGRVDHADLTIWRAHHGEYVARLVAHRAPEPATLGGALLGLLLVSASPRRQSGEG